MTAAVVEMPRLGQIGELADAIRAKADDPETAAYWEGFIVGYVATFTTDDVFTDSLTDARRHHFAQAYNLDAALSRWHLLGSNVQPERRDPYLRASGVLFGWLQGTAERPDAEQCSLCEGRILTDLDTEWVHCRSHGWMCNEDCLRGMCDTNCHRRDDVTGTF